MCFLINNGQRNKETWFNRKLGNIKMKLKAYELQVIGLLLKKKLSTEDWTKFLEGYELVDFEYTGAGYFLKIRTDNLNFEKETIHEPVLIGKRDDFTLGFILFVDENEIVMECHSWGELNPPENIRDLEVEINNDLSIKPKR